MVGPAAGPTPSRDGVSRGAVLRAALVAAVAVAAIFGAYEVAERVWLSERYPDALFLFHRIRGLTAALLSTALALWVLLRSWPSFLGGSATEEERIQEAPEEREAHYARWFISGRWVAILMATALVLVAVEVAELLPGSVRVPLLLTVGFLAVLNLGYAIWLRRGRALRSLLLTQLYGDLAVITVFLHLSGGVENPLAPLVLFHVVIAGIVLPSRHAYLVAGTGTALFATLAWAEWAGVLVHHDLGLFPHAEVAAGVVHGAHDPLYASSAVLLQGGLLFLVAHFTRQLARRLRRDERHLVRLTDEALERRQLLEEALDTTGMGVCVCEPDGTPAWMNDRWRSWFVDAGPVLGRGGRPTRMVREEWEMPGGHGAGFHGNGPGPSRGVGGPAGEAEPEGRAGPPGSAGFPGSGGPSEPAPHPGANGSAEPRTFRVMRAPLVGTQGQVLHLAGLAQDITEEKRAEAGIIRTERLAAVGELAGRVAHEVNNPMAIISAKARILLADRREDLSDLAAEELEKILHLSDRVARIAQGLLSYGRPAHGTRGRIDLRTPVRKALGVLADPAATAGIEVDDDLPDRPLPVWGNADELDQVCMNLVVNALDAMPDGGHLRVTGVGAREASARSGWIGVAVEDTGVGIPEADRQRIFEPFWTTKPDGKGTGLGLSICLGLVRSHGGEIEVASEAGKGTRVSVTFPAARVEKDHATEEG